MHGIKVANEWCAHWKRFQHSKEALLKKKNQYEKGTNVKLSFGAISFQNIYFHLEIQIRLIWSHIFPFYYNLPFCNSGSGKCIQSWKLKENKNQRKNWQSAEYENEVEWEEWLLRYWSWTWAYYRCDCNRWPPVSNSLWNCLMGLSLDPVCISTKLNKTAKSVMYFENGHNLIITL